MHPHMDRRTVGWTEDWTDRRTQREIGRTTEGRMAVVVDGRMGGWMDR